MYRALWSTLFGVLVTVVVSYMTTPKSEAELRGLVYGATEIPHEAHVSLWHRPAFWASVVGVVFVVLNILVW
jgi:SSS family solute:Na+ symporter